MYPFVNLRYVLLGEIVDKVTRRRIRTTMTRQYNVMAACVVALLTVLQLVSCDYKPQPKTSSDYVLRGEFLTKAAGLMRRSRIIAKP